MSGMLFGRKGKKKPGRGNSAIVNKEHLDSRNIILKAQLALLEGSYFSSERVGDKRVHKPLKPKGEYQRIEGDIIRTLAQIYNIVASVTGKINPECESAFKTNLRSLNEYRNAHGIEDLALGDIIEYAESIRKGGSGHYV